MIDYEAVKSAVSISQLLLKYGLHIPDHGRYAILCPFHQERTASMRVDNERGLFHCFGCGAAGSVIDLVARFDRTSIQEAAQKLATEFGVTETDSFRIDARRIQSRVNAWNAKPTERTLHIPYQLTELPPGYRGLSRTAIEHFQLALTDYGVFFPHFDLTGKVVGYSIRQPNGLKPKYLNSKYFPKTIPYGTYSNKQAIIDSGFAIVVEGQIDAISVWDKGFRNVVSLMGSSMTEPQGHLLLALTTKLLLLMDGDPAGRLGASKINKRWSSVFQIKLEQLPSGTDPADYLSSLESV